MDQINIGAEERVILGDLKFALNESVQRQSQAWGGKFLGRPGETSILSGFVPKASSSTGPVVVGTLGTENVALLAQNMGGEVLTGILSTDGNATQSIDISALPSNTYGIWVRFNQVETALQSRTFWDAVNTAEVTRSAYTRLTGSWEVRLEVLRPAPEWTQIGQAIVTAAGSGQGAQVVVVDQRPLFFEGTFGGLYRPTWGTAADRDLRRTATISNLATMVDALKQCIIDIKGPGAARWYDSFITGMNIGPGFSLGTPVVANRLAIGDANNYIQVFNPGTSYASLNVYFGTNRLYLDDASGQFTKIAGTQQQFTFDGNGYLTIGGYTGSAPLTVNSLGSFGGGEVALFVNRGSGQARGNLWSNDRISLSSAWGQGYLNEYPNPRTLWLMGTTNGQIQAGLLVNNNQDNPSYWYALRTISNSNSANDFTTSLTTKNVTLGSDGTVQIYGTLRYGNAKVASGALPFFAGSIVCTNGGSVTTFQAARPSDQNSAGTAYATPQPQNGATDSNKFMRITTPFDLPTSAFVVATSQQYSADGVDQKDWVISYTQIDSRTLDFVQKSGDGKLRWGSFSFMVMNGQV